MQFKNLASHPHFYNYVLQLIEKNFQYKEPFHFECDFYPLLTKSNHTHNHLLLDGEKLVGHIGVCLREWGDLKVAFIGGIAVDERYQKQGHFKTLMNHVLSLYQNECETFILWSDLHSMYEKFGFVAHEGLIQTGELAFEKPNLYEESTWKKLDTNEWEQIKSLYENMSKNFVTLKRQVRDWENIAQMSSTRLFLKRNANGKILGYFCVGKGQDLTDIIHEIAFESEEVKLRLYKTLGRFKLWLPESEKAHFPEAQDLILALIKGKLPQGKLYLSGLDSI